MTKVPFHFFLYIFFSFGKLTLFYIWWHIEPRERQSQKQEEKKKI